MDITFVLCPNIIGVFGLTILLIFTKFNFYLDENKLNMFRLSAVVNLLIIVLEVLDYLFGESPFKEAYIFRRFTSACGFALSPVFPLLIARIASPKKLPAYIYLPAAANVLMSFISIFTGHMFYITEGNSYSRGPLFVTMVAISVFYLLVLIYVSFANLKRVRYGESVFLICIVITMILCNVLEIAWAFHFVIWNCCAILLVSYYLFLHIQYFKFDPLTQVFNRSMFLSEIKNMEHKSNICAISFDLDNLKKINDSEGHAKGDDYIVGSAKLIERCFEDAGHLYRVGGDEFIVLIANTDELKVKEKICFFEAECEKSGISVSCGYSFHRDSSDLQKMLRDADEAMYENKRLRNRGR